MTAIIDELCRELRNYFVRYIWQGKFEISGGTLLPDSSGDSPADVLLPGQYYCVSGSVLNDGVHRWSEDFLSDETFAGEVWSMAVPPGFLSLVSQIAEYRAKWDSMAAEGKWTGFASESFGGYSYTLPSDAPVELREIAARIVAGKRMWRKVL